MAIARIGAHFCLFFNPKSVTAKNDAAKAASKPAIKESNRYIPFQVLVGKAAQIAIAVISKIIFAVIRRVSILCWLVFEDFNIHYQTHLTQWYSLILSITYDLKICFFFQMISNIHELSFSFNSLI